MKPRARQEPGIPVLHKTLNILETIKEAQAGLKLMELTRSLNLPKATVYRILATLEGRGYLDRRQDGTYRLARKLFELQNPVPLQQILQKAAQPLMERLVNSSKETINLVVLDGGEVVVINTMESPQSVRMSSKIGNRPYAHSSALGKVLLAGLGKKELLRVIRLKSLPRLTPHTLSNSKALLAALCEVRCKSYAIDRSTIRKTSLTGVALGAPILGPDDRVIAPMSISAPVFRMNIDQAVSFVPQLKEACAAISSAISTVW